MPLAYEISPEDERAYGFRGTHQRGLMGVDCPKCGVWATTGAEYPTVDAPMVDDVVPTKHFYGASDAEVLAVEMLQKLREKMAPLLGPRRPLVPGAKFGPLKAKASGRPFDDFVWPYPWTLLVRQPVFKEIQEARFEIGGVPADIAFRHDPGAKLIELEVLPAARIIPDPPFRICELCGRNPTIRGRDKRIDSAVPIQRLREWPTRMLITPDFADFVSDRGYTGIDWKKIEVV